MQEGLKELEVLLDPYDWFYEVCAEDRRYVVYVNYMESSQNAIIPDKMHGKQVVVHFASAKTGTANDYLGSNEVSLLKRLVILEDELGEFPPGGAAGGVAAKLRRQGIEPSLDEIIEDVENPNVDLLCRELDRLEKQCGSNILQDIFYEIHDGSNAVTNLRDRYPEVKASMQRLYNEYGFDAIYNELDG